MPEEQDTSRHLRRDIHEAYTDAKLAKMLATLALIGAALALALSMWALNKAGEAQSTANRATEMAQSK
jgi:hypothetical protein